MRKYEFVFIVHPELDETAFSGVIDKVRALITESGGSIDKQDLWGRRRLAYAIRKQKEGQFVLLNISMIPEKITVLEQSVRYLEPILRYMITVID